MRDLVDAVVKAGRDKDIEGQNQIATYTETRGALRLDGRQAQNLQTMPGRLRGAARQIYEMERINQQTAEDSDPLPLDRKELVGYGQISVVALSGYQPDMQATIFSLIAERIFRAKVDKTLKLPVLFVLEEGHNFAPARAETNAEQGAVSTTRKIAQEGRKFGIGLVLISQRPSRLDETTLSQCNSHIIMRMANPADQNYVRRVIETLGEEESHLLPDLDVREALLSGQFVSFPVLVWMKAPESKGEREEEDAFVALEKVRSEMKAGW